jgi:Uma2 family endonuclease
MNRARTAPPEIRTLADLLERLDSIPPGRIRFDPPPGTATEDDLIAIQCRKEGLFELVDGCIVEKAVGCAEATVTSHLITSVGQYLHQNDLGFGVGPSCLFRVARGVVRSPSLAFIAWDRLPRRRIPREEITDLVPDLVAEILRKDNTPAEIRRKRGEYFGAGVRLAWVIDPASRTARQYTTTHESALVREHQSLDGGEVLPGFAVRLADLFRDLEAE